MIAATPVETRALRKIEPCPTTGCWIWLGALHRNGYGNIRVGSMKDGTRGHRVAHRALYEALVGPIPAGMELDHLCRVRSCVNPAHLEPVTRRENLRRGGVLDALRRGLRRGRAA